MSVINLLLNKFKFQKRDYENQKEGYFFDYLNSFYPHEKNEGLSPALSSALSFCKRSFKNNDYSSSPGVYTYKFVDSKNSTIFTAFDDEKRVFPVKDPSELINDNLDAITVIYKSMASGDSFFKENILPYIHRAAAMCLTLPASEGSHDALPGGLLRHLLCTALESINLTLRNSGETDFFKQRSIKSAAFLAGINHDLAKIFTDFSIYAEGFEFNPYLESFAYFCKRVKARECTLRFISPRKGRHDELFFLSLGYLTQGLPQIFAYVEDFCPLHEFFLQKCDFFKYVKSADISSVKASTRSANPYSFNVNAFLVHEILSVLGKSQFEQLMPLGIFVVPYGLLVAYDSPLLASLKVDAKSFREGDDALVKNQNIKNLILEWRRQGNILLAGKLAVYSWHELSKDDDRFLVYGVTIALKTKNLKNHDALLCNALALGPRPKELSAYIERTYKDNIPGVIRLNHENEDKSFPPDVNEFLDDDSLNENLENSQAIFNEGIKDYQENLKVTKKKALDNKKLSIKAGQEHAQSSVEELNFLSESRTEVINDSGDESNAIFNLPDDLKEADGDEVVKNKCPKQKLNHDDALGRVDLEDLSVKRIKNDEKQEDHKVRLYDLKALKNDEPKEKGTKERSISLTGYSSEKSQIETQLSANLALESWLNAYSPNLPQFESQRSRKTIKP